jgi:hypothetical protein
MMAPTTGKKISSSRNDIGAQSYHLLGYHGDVRRQAHAIALTATLAACGRVGYDPVGDGGPGDQADAMRSPEPWWDDAWAHRRRVTVRNRSAQTMPVYYETRLVYDLDALSGVIGYDSLHLRHVEGQGNGGHYPMARCITHLPGGLEEMWFRTEEPLAPGEEVSHYFLYYGNPAASPPEEDPAQIFDFHADFAGLGNDVETLTGGESVTAGGELQLDPGESVRTLTTWGPRHAVDVVARVPTWSAGVSFGFQRDNDFVDDEPWMLWATGAAAGTIHAELLVTATGMIGAAIGGSAAVDGAAHTFTVERLADHAVFRVDGAATDRLDLPASYGADLQVRLRGGDTAPVFVDELRVRLVVDPEPEVILGPEETRP